MNAISRPKSELWKAVAKIGFRVRTRKHQGCNKRPQTSQNMLLCNFGCQKPPGKRAMANRSRMGSRVQDPKTPSWPQTTPNTLEHFPSLGAPGSQICKAFANMVARSRPGSELWHAEGLVGKALLQYCLSHLRSCLSTTVSMSRYTFAYSACDPFEAFVASQRHSELLA